MADPRDPGPEAVDRILDGLEDFKWSPTDVARQARRLRAHIEHLREKAITDEDSGPLLEEKDRLDRVSLEQCFTTDPVERIVGDALTGAGFEWRHEGHPARRNDPVTLDFQIVGGPHVEVKRFHTPRVAAQLTQAENVILIQGVAAARWFAEAIAQPLPQSTRE